MEYKIGDHIRCVAPKFKLDDESMLFYKSAIFKVTGTPHFLGQEIGQAAIYIIPCVVVYTNIPPHLPEERHHFYPDEITHTYSLCESDWYV